MRKSVELYASYHAVCVGDVEVQCTYTPLSWTTCKGDASIALEDEDRDLATDNELLVRFPLEYNLYVCRLVDS